MGSVQTRLVAPEIGALVEYGVGDDGMPRLLCVRGWLCPALPPATIHEFAALLYASAPRFDGRRLRWCLRPEATHLSLVGIGSAIVPVGACRVRGMLELPAPALEQARRAAFEWGSAGGLAR